MFWCYLSTYCHSSTCTIVVLQVNIPGHGADSVHNMLKFYSVLSKTFSENIQFSAFSKTVCENIKILSQDNCNSTPTWCPKFLKTSLSTIKNPHHIFQLSITITKITLDNLSQLNFGETIYVHIVIFVTVKHNWKI